MPPDAPQDWGRFEQQLQDIETTVAALRQRFEEVRGLLQERQALEQQLETPQTPPLRPEAIAEIEQRLEALSAALESTIFDWQALQEPFWQAVRFGGGGIVIGWVLRAIASR